MQKNEVQLEELGSIRNNQVFSGFTDDEFEKIQDHMYLRQYKKGQVLFDNGDYRNRIYFLIEGLVRVERYDSSGTFCYLDYVKKEHLFPYGGMFFDEFYHFSAYAVTDIEVYYIPTDIFEKISKGNTAQLLYFYQALSTNLESHELKIQYCLASSATVRVVETLAILMKHLGENYFSGTIRIPYPITLKEIAINSGTTRETASNVIKTLKKERKLDYCQKHLIFQDVGFFLENGEIT